MKFKIMLGITGLIYLAIVPYSATELTSTCVPVNIFSVNTNGDPLSGIKYTMYNQSGEEIGTQVSDGSGVASFSCVENGEYRIVEQNVPQMYTNNATMYNINVDGDKESVNIQNTHVDAKGGHLSIMVTSSSGVAVSGAEYGIYDSSGNLVDVIVTDKDGHAVSSTLPPGHYYVKQLSPGEGFVLSDEVYYFEIDGKNIYTQYTAEVEAVKGEVSFKVVDQYGAPVRDANFSLFNQDTGEELQASSNYYGKVRIDNVDYGKYMLYQKGSVQGYDSNNSQFSVVINGEGVAEGVPEKVVLNRNGAGQAGLATTGVNTNIIMLPMAVILSALVVIKFRYWS